MQIVAQFDPTSAASGTFNIAISPSNRGKIVIYNESAVNVILTFANGYQGYAPAWTAMLYCIHNLRSPIVTWQQQSMLGGANLSISQVTIEAYEEGEPLVGTYPASLIRQSNVGNIVTTSGGAMANLINDGNPATTQIIESTVSGGSSSNVSIDNSGNAFFAQTVGGLVSKLFQVIANAATTVILGLAGKTVEVLGSLKVDETSDFTGTITAHGTVNFNGAFSAQGTTPSVYASNGMQIAGGGLQLLVGSISRIAAVGQTTIAQAGTSVAHSLGVIPDVIIPIRDAGASSVYVITVNYGTATSTHFTAYSEEAAGTGNVRFLLIKF